LARVRCRADGAIEGLGDLGMDDTATHVHVLRHGNLDATRELEVQG